MAKWNEILSLARKNLKKLNSTKFRLFIVVFGVYLYFLNGFHSVNEWSRYSLILAIVEEHTFIIDKYILSFIDISYYNGHYYSDKPPGLSFLGVPVYFIAKFIINWWWITYLLIALIALFSSLSVVLIYELVGFLGGTKTSKILTALTYAFGTIAWVYSKTFFSHGFSAFLLLLSMYYARLYIQENYIKFIFLAGIAMGYSFLVDYSNLFLLIPFLLYFVLHDAKKKIFYFLLPVAIFLVILGAYHYICFDNPFNTPYMYQYRFGNPQNVGFFSNPVYIGLYGLLFSSYRGIFYLSPILLLSPWGCFILYEKYKPETVLILSSFIIFVLFYSTYILWHGGRCYGPRFILNVIPFFTLPIAQVIEKYKDLRLFLIPFFILMVYSIFTNAMGVVASYYVPEEIKNPFLYNFHYLQNGGMIDSLLFSVVSPITIFLPIILILICVAPTIIRYFRTREIKL